MIKIKNELYKYGLVLAKTGKIHQNQEVWNVGGVSPTIKATHYKDPPKILVKVGKKIAR